MTNPSELFRELSREAERLSLAEGDYLWREGDPGDCVVLLFEGRLEVVQGLSGDEPMVVRTLEVGSVVGELACLDRLGRSAGVRAARPSLIGRVSAERFREFIQEKPGFLEDLFWVQTERVRSLTSQMTQSQRRALTDRLTGLYNYGFFVERLELELDRARHMSDSVAVAIFDIDHFKRFNDTNGHQAGNDALVRVAEILRKTARRGDIVARFGGEEFVFLLYGASRWEARNLAEMARERVEAATIAGRESQPLGKVTVSGGVAAFPEDATASEALVKAADARLYRAKESGRNRVEPGD